MQAYCGAKEKLLKGQRRGTPQECYNMKQIRYYGTTIIPPSVKDDAMKLKELKATRMELLGIGVMLRARNKKMKDDLFYEKHRDKTEEYTKKIEENNMLIRDAMEKVKELDKIIEP